ncbi:HTTM domain-containing protein [Nocardioides sp. LML1-1-1.1]|uniref:HTTM domain-containing protein n=1 Tax=Nocardioides sp. LML1-1-1.1 TaxID=3135248 RepID=UPI003444D4F9
MATTFPEAVSRARESVAGWEDRLTRQRLAPYGVAASRVLAATTMVGILVTNFSHRSILFGPASDWVAPYRDPAQPTSASSAGWAGMTDALSPTAYTVFYLATVAVGVAFALGWHVRLTGPLLWLGMFQVVEANPLVGDQGDNILRVGLLWLLLTDNAGVWSLDARRERLHPGANTWWLPASARGLREALRPAGVVVHNLAVVGLACQLVIVYVAAGMYKVNGGSWKYGTAIHYPLNLDEYRVFPLLNDLATSSWLGVFVGTYLAVYLQLFFPVLLLNRTTRRIALVLVVLLHAGIAVTMGLPWFSLAMVGFDGIFVSTATWSALDRQVRARLARPPR